MYLKYKRKRLPPYINLGQDVYTFGNTTMENLTFGSSAISSTTVDVTVAGSNFNWADSVRGTGNSTAIISSM